MGWRDVYTIELLENESAMSVVDATRKRDTDSDTQHDFPLGNKGTRDERREFLHHTTTEITWMLDEIGTALLDPKVSKDYLTKIIAELKDLRFLLDALFDETPLHERGDVVQLAAERESQLEKAKAMLKTKRQPEKFQARLKMMEWTNQVARAHASEGNH